MEVKEREILIFCVLNPHRIDWHLAIVKIPFFFFFSVVQIVLIFTVLIEGRILMEKKNSWTINSDYCIMVYQSQNSSPALHLFAFSDTVAIAGYSYFVLHQQPHKSKIELDRSGSVTRNAILDWSSWVLLTWHVNNQPIRASTFKLPLSYNGVAGRGSMYWFQAHH